MELSNVRNLNIEIVRCIHRIRVNSFYDCKSRDADGLSYYINGEQRFVYDDMTINGTEGTLVYLPLGSQYKNYVSRPETEYYQVDFILREYGIPTPLFDSPKYFEKFEIPESRALMTDIMNNFLTLDNSKQFACFSSLCKLIDLAISKRQNVNQTALTRINKSVQYINEFYGLNTPISEIAAMSSTCVSNLERLFKQCFGVTPSEYRRMVRINRAKQLLLAGLTIDETAAEVGFYDSFHFSKTFKKLTGVPPGEYARNGKIN